MKKLFVILALFAVVIGLAVWEIVATTKFYDTTLNILDELEESFLTNEQLDSDENLAVLNRLESHWQKGRKLVLVFGNHTVVRNADERVTALGEFTRQNERSDATVSLKQAQRYITDLKQDVYPNLSNLL